MYRRHLSYNEVCVIHAFHGSVNTWWLHAPHCMYGCLLYTSEYYIFHLAFAKALHTLVLKWWFFYLSFIEMSLVKRKNLSFDLSFKGYMSFWVLVFLCRSRNEVKISAGLVVMIWILFEFMWWSMNELKIPIWLSRFGFVAELLRLMHDKLLLLWQDKGCDYVHLGLKCLGSSNFLELKGFCECFHSINRYRSHTGKIGSL